MLSVQLLAWSGPRRSYPGLPQRGKMRPSDQTYGFGGNDGLDSGDQGPIKVPSRARSES